MKAIIIGGGIGGLALAVALRRQSIDAEVYEQAEELREVGAGLVLWPNAVRALDALGLVPALRAVSVPFGDSEIRDWQGALLTRLSVPQGAKEQGALIYRTQLLALLAQAYAPDWVHLGARCVSAEQDAEEVTAHFANGMEARGDLLIGADGIHSTIRNQLFGEVSMRYAGYAVWRGTANVDIAQADTQHPLGTELWGRGLRFGYRATTPGRAYWYATANMPEGYTESVSRRRDGLLARFAGWRAPVLDILNGSDDAHILFSSIYNVAPLPNWSVGRITLLGDTAHALTPNLGQGACQAIEDAVTLAGILSWSARSAIGSGQPPGETIPSALRNYEMRRIPRVYAIAARARRLGEIGQWDNEVACALRNQAVKHLPEALRQRQMAWLFHFDTSEYTELR